MQPHLESYILYRNQLNPPGVRLKDTERGGRKTTSHLTYEIVLAKCLQVGSAGIHEIKAQPGATFSTQRHSCFYETGREKGKEDGKMLEAHLEQSSCGETD